MPLSACRQHTNGRPAEAFGVYVHWPFCQQKCPYCDFNSHVRFQGWDEAAFLEAFKRELSWCYDQAPGQMVESIFFGGGTPSLMQPSTVAGIIDHIATLWPVAHDAEVTLEANPGSVEAGRFSGYRQAGVNRRSTRSLSPIVDRASIRSSPGPARRAQSVLLRFGEAARPGAG